MTIDLKVKGIKKLQLGSRHITKVFPEIIHKSIVFIKDYSLEKTIQLENIIKIDFHNFKNIYGFSTKNNMSYFREYLNNHEDKIILICIT